MANLAKKTTLVTGGAGFIGSHLVEELKKRGGGEVLVLDDYSTGSERNHVIGARYVRGSTREIARLIRTSPQTVFHLGEYARTSASFGEIERVFESNIEGTFRVLEFCRARGSKLVYAGSSTKFSDGGTGRIHSPYAWTKAVNTDLVVRYGEWFGLSYAITYFYNVYGEREIEEGAYATFIGTLKRHYLRGEKLPIVSPGTQRRDFTYVKDIVRGLVLAGEQGQGDGYCLGTGREYSLLEVASFFDGEVEMLPERRGDRRSSAIDLRKSRTELDWEATTRLEDYIARVKKSA